ncbi:hypothetical protein FK507_28505, partial [Klebsiella pneumoniae]|uniref:hypothetical protein n=1 Tax=Klebsiella pneumoniae TaxID=573 RepID=UPI0021C329FC
MMNRLKPRILGISILFIIIIILTCGAVFKFKFKLDNKLKEIEINYSDEEAVCVMLTSGGYP